jgi:hypothetical protein
MKTVLSILLTAGLSAVLTGCQYDRSFLQLNSDSGVPFLGLQLSVDASDAQQDARDSVPLRSVHSATEFAVAGSDVTTADRNSSRSTSIDAGFAGKSASRHDRSLVLTSQPSAQPPRIRMTLPEEKLQQSTVSTQQRLAMF